MIATSVQKSDYSEFPFILCYPRASLSPTNSRARETIRNGVHRVCICTCSSGSFSSFYFSRCRKSRADHLALIVQLIRLNNINGLRTYTNAQPLRPVHTTQDMLILPSHFLRLVFTSFYARVSITSNCGGQVHPYQLIQSRVLLSLKAHLDRYPVVTTQQVWLSCASSSLVSHDVSYGVVNSRHTDSPIRHYRTAITRHL